MAACRAILAGGAGYGEENNEAKCMDPCTQFIHVGAWCKKRTQEVGA